MPGVTSSHTISVSFDGNDLGSLLSVDIKCQAGSTVDVTHMGSAVVGAGNESRTVKEVAVLSVEPARIEISFLGATGFGVTDPGTRATLAISGSLGLSAEAILIGWGEAAQVGEFIKGSGSFVLTGI